MKVRTASALISIFILCLGLLNQKNGTAVSICDNCSTIAGRFKVPKGFVRVKVKPASFQEYLRNLPLKNISKKVKYFNGRVKENNNIYISVVNQDIDRQDLQQCADAVIRLKAEYHYNKTEYDKIHFNFLSDGKPRYYKNYAKGDYSYKKFRKYLRYIFSYANTASLFHEMKRISINTMRIGDVFIQKGKPYGHTVIIVDMAENPRTGEKIFMLAQSFMPAQETQILINPDNAKLSPWYTIKRGKLHTPEWVFDYTDLKRFKD